MSSTRTNNPPAAALSAILPTFELNGVSKCSYKDFHVKITANKSSLILIGHTSIILAAMKTVRGK